jgi:hypothetical protein
VIAARGLSTRATGHVTDLYFVMLGPGVGVCIDTPTVSACSPRDFCAYHDRSDGLVYAVVAWSADRACDPGDQAPNTPDLDATVSAVSHEHIEMLTDPYGGGWLDGAAAPNEIADICRSRYGEPLGGEPGRRYNQVINGHPYWVQGEWSNDGNACAQRYTPTITGGFTAVPTAPLAHQAVAFAAEGTSTTGAITSISWDFGDGTVTEGAQVTHAFASGGARVVTVTLTDERGGTRTYVTRVQVGAAPSAALRVVTVQTAARGTPKPAGRRHHVRRRRHGRRHHPQRHRAKPRAAG